MRKMSLLLPIISSLLFISLHAEKNHHYQSSAANEYNNKIIKPCPKPHFVLVHGYGGGAWSWYKIQSLMEASGYGVKSLDLKGAGRDLTNSSQVLTFDAYDQPLIDYLAKLPDDEKVILVGHSAGGLSLTDASHKFSKKIKVAVYVAATMLKHGYMTQQDVEDGVPHFLRPHRMGPTLTRGRHHHQTRNATPEILKCHLPPISHIFSQEDGVLSGILFRPVPVEALLSARFEGNEAEEVKRVYIKTLYDHVLLPQQQNAMIRRWPPVEVLVVETDHGIIGSDPFVLFGLLVKVAISTICN